MAQCGQSYVEERDVSGFREIIEQTARCRLLDHDYLGGVFALSVVPLPDFRVFLPDFGAVLLGAIVSVDGDMALLDEGIVPVEELPMGAMSVDDAPFDGIAPGVPDCIPGMLPDG